MQKKELKTFNYILLLTLFTIPTSLEGQTIDTTLSGQVILLYSDFTWELYDENVDSNNPFEFPSEDNNKKELLEKKERIISFLKREEILSYISFKKASFENLTNVQDYFNNYESISADILLLSEITVDDKDGHDKVQNQLDKYFGNSNQKEKIIYDLPKTEGKYLPVSKDCQTTEKLNEDRNTTIKTTSKSQLLTYTPTKLQNYYKQKNYLTVYNSISKTGEKYLLNFEFVFNSKDIEKSYGTLPSDGFLRISFINNKIIFLEMKKSVYAKIENYTGKTIYTFSCEVKEKEDQRLLERKYINEIGLLWSSGFESYPVFDIQHFIKKTNCLND